MSKKKNNILIPNNFNRPVLGMSDEDAGKFIKAVFNYHQDEDVGELNNTVQFAFELIKPLLEENKENYKKICKRNARNGSKGGRPVEKNNPEKPSGLFSNPVKPKIKENKIKENKINTYVKKDFDDLRDWWNDSVAIKYNLPKIQMMTEKRKLSLKNRIKEAGGVDEFKNLVSSAFEKSSFLRGDNGRGWSADFDFCLQQKSFVKIAEGVYSEKKKDVVQSVLDVNLD